MLTSDVKDYSHTFVNRLCVIDFSSHFYFFFKNFFSKPYNTRPLFYKTVPPCGNSGTGSGTAESLMRQGLEPICTAVPAVPAFWKLFFFQKSILLRKLYIESRFLSPEPWPVLRKVTPVTFRNTSYKISHISSPSVHYLSTLCDVSHVKI